MIRSCWLMVLATAPMLAQYNIRGVDGMAVDNSVRVPRSEPKVAWEIRPGFRDFGAMAVSNGVVVTGNVNGGGGAFGFDAATGKKLWSIPGHLRGMPAVDARAAYVMNTVSGDNTRLSAVDLKTGRRIWAVEGDYLGTYDDAPLVTGGRLFLLNRTGKATAYDAATGKLLWEQPYDWDHGNCPTSIAYADGLIYFGGGESGFFKSMGRFLWALEAASGRVAWKFQTTHNQMRGGECVSAPAVAAGIVAITSENVVYALDARSGRVLWQQAVKENNRGAKLSEPLILNGAVWAYSAQALHAWDLWKGTPVDTVAGDFEDSPASPRMTTAGGLIFFLASLKPEQGKRRPLQAYDPKARQVLWTHYVNRDVKYFDTWRTRNVLPADGALYYENAMILVKLQ